MPAFTVAAKRLDRDLGLLGRNRCKFDPKIAQQLLEISPPVLAETTLYDERQFDSGHNRHDAER